MKRVITQRAHSRALMTLELLIAAGACASAAHGQAIGFASVAFRWTDRVGNTHPLGHAYSIGFDDDSPLTPPFVPAGFGYNNSFGLNAFFGADPLPFDSTVEFFGWVSASIGPGGSEVARVRNSSGFIYRQGWGIFNVTDPPGTGSFTHTADNTTYSGAAMGILMPVAHMYDYYRNVHGATIPFIPIDYHAGTSGSFYLFNTRLQIDNNDWASSDVIMHEYGHHIAQNNGMTTGIGGPHAFGGDNIRGTGRPGGTPPPPAPGTGLGALAGTQLAWGEAIATYLGISAVRDGNMGLRPYLSGIPATDLDTFYDDFDATGSTAADFQHLNFGVDVEFNRGRVGAAGGGPAGGRYRGSIFRGEGAENSVLHVLWDLNDANNENQEYRNDGVTLTNWLCGSDRITYGATTMYSQVLRGGGGDGTPNTTFGDTWDDLVSFVDTAPGRAGISGLATMEKPEAVAACGEILGEAGISGIPTGASDADTPRPTFEWIDQNNANSRYFRILVWSLDWTDIVYDSGRQDDGLFNGFNTFQNTSFAAHEDIPQGDYFWNVLNSPAVFGGGGLAVAGLNDIYAWYWSGAKPLSVVPAPGTMVLVLAGFSLVRRRRRSC